MEVVNIIFQYNKEFIQSNYWFQMTQQKIALKCKDGKCIHFQQ